MKKPILKTLWRSAMKRLGNAAYFQAGISTPAELMAELDRGYYSIAGPQVTSSSALGISTVFACVRNISEDIATLPCQVFRRLDADNKEPAPDHPAAVLLRKPNAYQTRVQFLKWLVGSRCLRGNGLAIKNVVRNQTKELLPCAWDNVAPWLNDFGEPIYTVQMSKGATRDFSRAQVVHTMGFSTDGYQGLSPVSIARDSIGLTLAGERHASRVFKNGGTSRIFLQHPESLGEGEDGKSAAKNIRDSWAEIYGAEENWAKVAVLEEGITAHPLSLSPQDIQFLQSREFQIEEVCRWFRMAPHMVQHLARSTNNNIEQQSLEHVVYTLRPPIVDLEAVLTQDLIGGDGEYFIEFNIAGLLRGNTKDRFLAHATGRQWGWLSVNDVRRLENMNPIGPGGDVYLRPVNMVPAGDAPAAFENAPTADRGANGAPGEGQNGERS